MLTCPKCKKNAHPICTNEKCACRTNIPEGEKPLIYRPMFWRFTISRSLFNSLWHFISKMDLTPSGFGLYELDECPYCGFRGSLDFWTEREMEQSFPTSRPNE